MKSDKFYQSYADSTLKLQYQLTFDTVHGKNSYAFVFAFG